MAKTSIYLPDDLAEQVRARGIPVSEVAQAALRQAVKAAEIKENVMTDIQAVAARLNATLVASAERLREQAAEVKTAGAEWARTTASAYELEYVAAYSDAPEDFITPHSLKQFIFSSEYSRLPSSPADRYWQDFRAGAREVRNAVAPFLIEIDDEGCTREPGSGGYSETACR